MTMIRSRVFLQSLCGAFVFLLCVGSAPAAVVTPMVAESGAVIVTTETAEVREGPGSAYDVMTVVAKGEIFDKQGRTGAWYYIRINDDTFGWVSGRAISRYQADETDEADEADEPGETGEGPSSYVETREAPIDRGYDPYYPYYPGYYPGYYYDYPFYSWGLPYYSSGYYYYDNHYYPRRSWDHDGGHSRTWENRQYRSDSWQRDGGSNRNYNRGPRVVPGPRPPGPPPRMSIPRARPSFPRNRR